MNELLETKKIKIEDMIYKVRGKQIMLASDVALLYKTETKIINQVVKRNIERFPDTFCFQLTSQEYSNLRSQIVTSNLERNKVTHGGTRYLPYAFTEHGIIMLSGQLNNDIAINLNVKIIEAFVTMKKHISSDLIEQSYINKKVLKHDEDIKLLQESFTKLSSKEVNNHMFFEGEIYDAYSKIIDIFNEARKEIIIIDNYLDKNMLDIISKAKVKVILITADKLDNIDLIKYRKQYNNLSIVINKSFHDRFIIIDKKILYHLGASLNSLGKKCFAISKIDENQMLENLLKRF